MKHFAYIITCLLAVLAVSSCGKGGGEGRVRSVYYWSTVLDIDSAKRGFIERHGVGRIYVRYFDVVQGDDGLPRPNATLRFKTGVPEGVEVVPTVYIVNECIMADTARLAERTLRRILYM